MVKRRLNPGGLPGAGTEYRTGDRGLSGHRVEVAWGEQSTQNRQMIWFVLLVLQASQEATQRPFLLPEAYRRRIDQDRARLFNKAMAAGHPANAAFPCELPNGQSLSDEQCYVWKSPEKFRGIWLDQFEGSQFFPNRKAMVEGCAAAGGIWLQFKRKPASKSEQRGGFGQPYAVEFIGRQMRYPSPSGHFGLFKSTIMVDRMLSIRAVPSRCEPPKVR